MRPARLRLVAPVLRTATATAILVGSSAPGVTVGPSVSATSTGTGGGAALQVLAPASATGVTATANGSNGVGGFLVTGAPVTDSTFSGGGVGGVGLDLEGGTAQRGVATRAKRVVATGARGIVGDGALVTDSLAIGETSAAVGASSGSPLQLRNVTAISAGSGAPGIEARAAIATDGPGAIVAENVIARGGSGGTDVVADTSGLCTAHSPCKPGSVQIGYSNFASASTGVDSASIGHNESGDPLFVDGTVGPSQDFHLQNDSPAIGAGTVDAQTGTSDLDGKPRPAGGQSEPSLGAYEPTGDTLTVKLSGSGSGSVSGSGISCPGSCSKVYAPGTTVTLSAAPGSGSLLSGWSGACSGTGACQVTMSSEHTVTATFTAPLPSNRARPLIGGITAQGKTLVASDGTWTGSPSAFTYRWQDCDAGGNKCTSIAGATGNTHKLTATDVGHTMRIVVTATNVGGSTSATSAHTATVTGLALSHVRLGSSAFTANHGTTLILTLSEAATVDVLVTQARHGRKVKGRCKPGAKHGKRCTLTVQKAKLAFRGASGPNRFNLLLRSLAPGRYTATITARAKNGENSNPVKLNFTIKKPNKK